MRDMSKLELQSELTTVLSHMVWGSSHVALRFSATPTFDNRKETADFLRQHRWFVFSWEWLREIATGENGLDSLAGEACLSVSNSNQMEKTDRYSLGLLLE